MIFTVHTELRHGTAGDNHHVLKDTRPHECGGICQCVYRRRTETADIAAGCMNASRFFADGFCDIAASALVYIARSFLGTLDNIIDVRRIDAFKLREVPCG